MSSSGKHTSKSKDSVIGFILSLPFRLIGWIILGWLCAIFIFIGWIILKGHAAGLDYCLHVLGLELEHCYKSKAYGLFELKILQGLSNQIPTKHFNKTNNLFGNTIKILYPIISDYVRCIIGITGIVLIRLINLSHFIFSLLLLASVGFIHGVTQRYLRRINGGRESALIYHYAKASIKAFIFWGSLLYIVTPCYIEPATLLLPSIIGSSLGLFFTAKMFKKYS